ncbi:hypothetical protein BCR43DRAFT_476454 [Syncephalastrum racemosum]|uniref:Uncharacterized protein n=1 Tax=Syncephalastrum racemosum TaxID=13706 RepID=A0A1X2H7X7_SYNRA|nr:hypothetical protein BCR43DRAFT_476454 [Syncephalastrum racemosum]
MLNPQEKNAFTDIFREADAERKGVLLKDEAFAFFKKADIPNNILSEIWDAADGDRKGFLTEEEFYVALKLIACAQHGVIPASPVLSTSVPLPQFEGVHITPVAPPNRGVQPTHTGSVSSPASQPRGLASPSTDIIRPDERNKYVELFRSSNPVAGVLSGEQAKTIFLRSNLSPALLGRIWSLADTRKSGTLNQTEFIIAMHYISRAMQNETVPPSLPASIYASAASSSGLNSPIAGHKTGSPILRRQGTLASNFGSFQAQQPAPGDFNIPPDEFIRYKGFFEQLDTSHAGTVSGQDAVVFFRHSKLPEHELAHIWDLADTSQNGQLNLQQFAFAMHLINKRMQGSNLFDQAGFQSPAHQTQQQPQQQSQQQQQQLFPQQTGSIDLLGLSGESTGAKSEPAPLAGPSVSALENNLTTLRNETREQMGRRDHLRTQYESEIKAVRELEESIAREKETLDAFKRAANDAERDLEAAKRKKEKLTQELQIYRQESRHYKQRAEHAREETQQLESETAQAQAQAQAHAQKPTESASNDLFTLSSAPTSSNHMFGTASASSVSSMSPKNTFDAFATIRKTESPVSSPTMSLNHMRDEAEAKQQLRSAATVQTDLSDIEQKFPDLTTMEQKFQSPTRTEFPNLTGSPRPQTSSSSAPSNAFASPKPASAALSPSQAKSVAKYGIDLSAFEDDDAGANKGTSFSSSSVRNDLSSLISSPSQREESKAATSGSNNFDDIFGAPAPVKKDEGDNSGKDTQKKSAFDEMFFS